MGGWRILFQGKQRRHCLLNWVIAVIGTSILAIARKNANECGNIVVVLFHTSFVKEASFLNRMNYLHGKSIHAQLQCSSIRFFEEISQSLYFLGTVVNVFYITYTSFNSHKFYKKKKKKKLLVKTHYLKKKKKKKKKK